MTCEIYVHENSYGEYIINIYNLDDMNFSLKTLDKRWVLFNSYPQEPYNMGFAKVFDSQKRNIIIDEALDYLINRFTKLKNELIIKDIIE